MIEPLRTGVSFYNTTRDIIKGLRARMKSQASELEALQRVFSLACSNFHRLDQQQSCSSTTTTSIGTEARSMYSTRIRPPGPLVYHHLSRLRPSCSTTSKSEALHACQLSTGLLSLPRKPFRQPASSHTPRPAQVSSFAQGASACANHLALAAGMTLCYTNRERMRKSTVLRRSPAASE